MNQQAQRQPLNVMLSQQKAYSLQQKLHHQQINHQRCHYFVERKLTIAISLCLRRNISAPRLELQQS